MEAAARSLLAPHLDGQDGEELAGHVLGRLARAGATLAVAEGCTGGHLAALLTDEPAGERLVRAADVVLGDPSRGDAGAVSAASALLLAEGARQGAGATWGLAVTGWAGPHGGTPEDPVGTVSIAVAGPQGTQAERRTCSGERRFVRHLAAATALDVLRRALPAT